VLLLDGESSRLVQIPAGEPAWDRSHIVTRLRLGEGGRSEQTTRVSERGQIASESRAAVSELSLGQQEDLIQAWYAPEIGSFEVVQASFPNVSVLEESLQFEYVAERSLPLSQFNSGTAIVVPFQLLGNPLAGMSLRDRKTALDVSPMRGEYCERIEIELAVPWIPIELPAPVEIELEEAEYSFAAWIGSNGAILVQRKFVLRAFEIAPERCQVFREFMDRVSQADRSVILLGKT
jgi:hypothetical protein